MKSLAYLSNIEFIEQIGKAEASISLNPLYSWAKLIICDSEKNANKQRIKEEEFDNIIRTGIFSPIKMPLGGKITNHEDARGYPIGTITQINKSGNQLEALAAFWKQERPEEVEMLKKMVEAGKLPQVSWEIFYEDSSFDEDGTEDLIGVILNGLAIVRDPAYEGRTSIFAMAEKNTISEETNITMEELEKVQQELITAKESLSQKDAQVLDLVAQIKTLEEELNSLREFKNTVETERANAEKIKNIKDKFNTAGITKDVDYFNSNLEKLLALSEEALDFMIQELVAFSLRTSDSEKMPNLLRNPRVETDPKALGKALKESKQKKL